MKILYITNSLSLSNGWGKTAFEIIKGVQDHGIETMVFAQEENCDLRNVSKLPLKSFKNNRYKYFNVITDYNKLKKYAKSTDIIHCLVEPFLPLAALLKRKHNHLILTAHGTHATLPLKSSLNRLYMHSYKKTDMILPNSRYTARQLIKAIPFLKEKIKVINLGVSPVNTTTPIKPRNDRSLSFISVGEIKPRKGTLYILEAMKEVVKKTPNLKFYLIGNNQFESDYIREIKHKIESYSLQQNVVLTGKVSNDELISYYQNSCALVMPSTNENGHYEGFGLVHLEANSYGLPVIGSYNCGNEDAIIDGYNGFLVEQQDAQQLSKLMLKFTNPSFDWDKISGNALEHSRNLSWDKVVNEYLNIYAQYAC